MKKSIIIKAEHKLESFNEEFLVCESCESTKNIRPESSRTAYPWDGEDEDPNREVYLCRSCAEKHHEFWDNMWAETYSNRM